jgi:hypothetical protein
LLGKAGNWCCCCMLLRVGGHNGLLLLAESYTLMGPTMGSGISSEDIDVLDACICTVACDSSAAAGAGSIGMSSWSSSEDCSFLYSEPDPPQSDCARKFNADDMPQAATATWLLHGPYPGEGICSSLTSSHDMTPPSPCGGATGTPLCIHCSML